MARGLSDETHLVTSEQNIRCLWRSKIGGRHWLLQYFQQWKQSSYRRSSFFELPWSADKWGNEREAGMDKTRDRTSRWWGAPRCWRETETRRVRAPCDCIKFLRHVSPRLIVYRLRLSRVSRHIHILALLKIFVTCSSSSDVMNNCVIIWDLKVISHVKRGGDAFRPLFSRVSQLLRRNQEEDIKKF